MRGLVIFSSLILSILLTAPSTYSQTTDKDDEMSVLKKKIADLEKEVSELKEQKSEEPAKSPEETALEKELAEELGMKKDAPQGGEGSEISEKTLAARQNFFQNMNPNVSVIGTVLGNATTFDAVDRNVDLSFEEGEFAFQAAVDPFAKADFYIAFGKHAEPAVLPEGLEEEEEEEEGGLEPEIEEAFITFLSLPFSTQLKAGKFRGKFGKINETHPHAYNFISVPLMYTNFFGAEGLIDEGVGISWLLPNSAFFQELTIQVTSGPGENASFTRSADNYLLYLAHLKNFFDLNDNTTLELGVTGMTGPNNEDGSTSRILAGDVTLKWKPLQFNRYKSFEFKSEFLVSNRDEMQGDVTSVGLYSHMRYQFAKQWFIGGLFDYAEFPQLSDVNQKAYSGILQFFTTEFQKVELQYKYNDGNFFDNFSEVMLRAVFVIGAHGAHQY